MPGQLQTKNIGDVKCLLRTIVIPSHVLKKKTEREKKNVDQLSSIPLSHFGVVDTNMARYMAVP